MDKYSPFCSQANSSETNLKEYPIKIEINHPQGINNLVIQNSIFPSSLFYSFDFLC
jgi:hypothetical protein